MNEQRVLELIRECQKEADKAIQSGNPPFGCVIADTDGNIVSRSFNAQYSDHDPTAHAEIRALRYAGQSRMSPYLDDCVMYANASSCSMCMSAAIKAHITKFVYGAPPEESMDPWLTMQDIAAKSKRNIKIFGPILGDECAAQIANGRESLRAARDTTNTEEPLAELASESSTYSLDGVRLFLSSKAVTSAQSQELLKLVGATDKSKVKLGLIENGADVYAEDDKDWLVENRQSIMDLGVQVEQIDLRNYMENRDMLLAVLKDKDILWIGGGNTYYLRWILRETGADEIIVELVKNGTVYGGGSAGAIVAGPTLDHFQAADDPAKAPQVVLEGLGLTDAVVVPHVGHEKYGNIMEQVERDLKKDGYETIPLTDAQVFVVSGEGRRVLG